MAIRRSFIVASLVLLALAACSSDDDAGGDTGSTGASSPTEAETTPPPSESPASGGETEVEAEDSSLGTILVDADGNTLYVFMQDTSDVSTCTADCAANWPALVAEGEVAAGGDVDQSLLSTSEHPDGSTQVTYNGHPLYYFAGDQAPGDTNGQAVGDIWYVVSPEGEPIT